MTGRMRDVRDFISPLLQPPLNRLFVPRPTPEYIPPLGLVTDKKGQEQFRRFRVHVAPTSSLVALLAAPVSASASAAEDPNQDGEIEEAKLPKAERIALKRARTRQAIDAELALWDPKSNEKVTSDAFRTLFVGRLPYDVTEGRLRREFERYGPLRSLHLVQSSRTGRPRGYAFVEFEREKDMKMAYVESDGMRLDGRRVVVDVERGRTVKGWRPRRLGGGLGRTRVGGKEQNQRHSGRDPRANDMLEELVRSGGYHPSRKRSPSRDPLRQDRDRERERDRGRELDRDRTRDRHHDSARDDRRRRYS